MKRRMIALLLALLMLALTGCGNWDTSELEDPLRDLTDYYETDEKEETPVLTAFTLPYFSNQTLDPITCPDGAQLTLGTLLYEGLFALDEQFSVQNVLARSYSYDADTFTYTIKVRSDIRFSDGSRLSAYDVADTLQRARSSERYRARLAMVNSLYAEDSDTVSISLSQDNRCFTARLDIPIVKSGTETNLVPTGTGPYTKGSDTEALYPNDHWWRSVSLPFQEIGLLPCKSEEAAAYAFSSHDVHLLFCDLTGVGGDVASTSGSHTDTDTTILQYLGFNMSRRLFEDDAMRLAISMAVDRSAIVSAYLVGHGAVTQYPINPASPLYPKALERSYTADDCAAAMAELNMADGEGIYDLTLLVNSEYTFKVAAAQGIAQALNQYDFNVTVNALPWEEYLAALSEGRFDLYYGEYKMTADWDMTPLLYTGGSLNYGGWSDPLTDSLLETCCRADDSSRAAALEAVCRRLQSQTPIIPICFKRTSVLLPYGAVDTITPTAADPFYKLENWAVSWGTVEQKED